MQIARFLAATGRGVVQEIRLLRWRGPRAILAAQTVGSVLLAVLLADLLNLKDRWWVAISAYVVMRADWETSLSRALQRLAGTVCGAVLGALLAPWVLGSRSAFALGLAVVAAVGLYRAIGSVRSYGWVLATITALLVLGEAPDYADVRVLALQRVIDVLVGTLACVAVAGLVHLLRLHFRSLPQASTPQSYPAGVQLRAHDWPMRKLRAWQALQAAITLGVLGLLAFHRHIPGLPQILVTVIVVLLVPLPALLHRSGEENVVAVRMINRALGCLLAALIALLLLPLIGGEPPLCMIALSAGVWLAAQVQSGNAATSYIGTQFGVAFLMVFVQDRHWSTDVSPVVWRLLGILGGIAALALVMLATASLRSHWPGRRLR